MNGVNFSAHRKLVGALFFVGQQPLDTKESEGIQNATRELEEAFNEYESLVKLLEQKIRDYRLTEYTVRRKFLGREMKKHLGKLFG